MSDLTLDKVKEVMTMVEDAKTDEPKYFHVAPEPYFTALAIDYNQSKWFGLKGVLMRLLYKWIDWLEAPQEKYLEGKLEEWEAKNEMD